MSNDNKKISYRLQPIIDKFLQYHEARCSPAILKAPEYDLEKLCKSIMIKVRPVFEEIRQKYRLQRNMTIRDFYRISKGEDLNVLTGNLDKYNAHGMYVPAEKNIYLEWNLSTAERRSTAAHELGHHFMHGQAMLSQPELFSTTKDLKNGDSFSSPERIMCEWEADIFGSLLLTVSTTEVRNAA